LKRLPSPAKEKIPARRTWPGLAFAGEIVQRNSWAYLVLAELQGLGHNGLLVVAKAAAKAKGRRDNDRASY
jgi:hypothetical protein